MSRFQVIEHTVQAQHIRQRLAAVEPDCKDQLKLSLKQYVPKSNPQPMEGDVTLIAAHANGFPKEIYEPLWDDLDSKLILQGRRIRSIWIADVAHQGRSGILNEHIIGNDPSCWDHALDLLHIVNLYREQMLQPIIGIGHSMGGLQMVQLSLVHPSLFHSLVLIDPVIQKGSPTEPYARSSMYRRDNWSSRESAANSFQASEFYQRWDPRVLEKWMLFGLRNLPPEVYPKKSFRNHDEAVTLTTSKAQEVFTFVRPTYRDEDLGLESGAWVREMHPDDFQITNFYQPEPAHGFRRLPELRPSVLYVFGDISDISPADAQNEKLVITGTGVGGSGGASRGRVKKVSLPCGHLIPMERPNECASASAEFIEAQAASWQIETDKFRTAWSQKPRSERLAIDQQWKCKIGKPTRRNKI